MLPGLAQRLDGIPLLMMKLPSSIFPVNAATTFDLTSAAMQRLQTYHWPGNIRELVNVDLNAPPC